MLLLKALGMTLSLFPVPGGGPSNSVLPVMAAVLVNQGIKRQNRVRVPYVATAVLHATSHHSSPDNAALILFPVTTEECGDGPPASPLFFFTYLPTFPPTRDRTQMPWCARTHRGTAGWGVPASVCGSTVVCHPLSPAILQQWQPFTRKLPWS